MSVIDPLSCGFVKIGAYNVLVNKYNIKKIPTESNKTFKSRLYDVQYGKFNEYFNTENNENLRVSHKQFSNNFLKIIKYIRNLNKRYQHLKQELFDVFSMDSWKQLTENKKAMHSVINCQGCFKDANLKAVLAKLPIKSIKQNAKAKKSGLFKEKVLSDVTNKRVNELNEEFRASFSTNFVKQAKKYVPQFKENKSKDVITSVGKSVVKECKDQFSETSVIR